MCLRLRPMPRYAFEVRYLGNRIIFRRASGRVCQYALIFPGTHRYCGKQIFEATLNSNKNNLGFVCNLHYNWFINAKWPIKPADEETTEEESSDATIVYD